MLGYQSVIKAASYIAWPGKRESPLSNRTPVPVFEARCTGTGCKAGGDFVSHGRHYRGTTAARNDGPRSEAGENLRPEGLTVLGECGRARRGGC
jgi:hypothetical protein